MCVRVREKERQTERERERACVCLCMSVCLCVCTAFTSGSTSSVAVLPQFAWDFQVTIKVLRNSSAFLYLCWTVSAVTVTASIYLYLLCSLVRVTCNSCGSDKLHCCSTGFSGVRF